MRNKQNSKVMSYFKLIRELENERSEKVESILSERIDRAKVMKRAWSIFRGSSFYSLTFSMSLKRAWEIEKCNRLNKAIEQQKEDYKAWHDENKEFVKEVISYSMGTPANDYNVSGAYHGD